MKSFAEYEQLAELSHGHMCAGQVLGLRLAIRGMRLLGLEDPAGKDRKRLVAYVEIDRCATDAITVVTGCRMGKRTLKFRDFGKVAATFCDITANKAVRVVAKESAKQRAAELHPELPDRNQQQMISYREMHDDELLDFQWVQVVIGAEELPGFKGPRIACQECGEGINFQREVLKDGRTLCRSCAGERYYQPL